MDQTETEIAVQGFLKKLAKDGIVEQDALAAIVDINECSEHGAVQVLVISKRFGQDRLAEGIALEKVAWETAPNIQPFPVSVEQWSLPEDRVRLHRAKTRGKIIKL